MAHCLDLVPFPMKIWLFIGEHDWVEFCEKNALKDRNWIDSDSEAHVSIDNQGNIFLCFSEIIDDVGIIAHECLHCVQALMAHICQTEKATEVEAYYLQHIVNWAIKKILETPVRI